MVETSSFILLSSCAKMLLGIIGLTALLIDTPLNQDQMDLIGSIRECSDGLLVVVNDVVSIMHFVASCKTDIVLTESQLDFSKIEAGKLQLESRPFSLQSTLDHVHYMMNLKAKEKGIQLHLDMGEEVPKYLEGDTVRVRQVLSNLVSFYD